MAVAQKQQQHPRWCNRYHSLNADGTATCAATLLCCFPQPPRVDRLPAGRHLRHLHRRLRARCGLQIAGVHAAALLLLQVQRSVLPRQWFTAWLTLLAVNEMKLLCLRPRQRRQPGQVPAAVGPGGGPAAALQVHVRLRPRHEPPGQGAVLTAQGLRRPHSGHHAAGAAAAKPQRTCSARVATQCVSADVQLQHQAAG